VLPTGTPPPSPSGISIAGILGRPTDTAITVNVLPAVKGDLFFEYGTESGKFRAQTQTVPASAEVPIQALIANLQRNTRYYYRARYRSDGEGEFSVGDEHTFTTQRNSGEPFTFTIDADPHNQDPNFNGELYDVTLANALKDRPDFHVNLGDTFMTEKLNISTLDGVVGTYTSIRPHFAILCGDAPLFLVNGNHEGELGWLLGGGENNLAVWCTETRRAHYPTPVPGGFYSGSGTAEPVTGIRDGYYAWTWGDALFIALDPFWYTRPKPPAQANGGWGWTLGQPQYAWLKQTLETSSAKYKFVFIHHLVGGNDKDARGGIEMAGNYEWGGKNSDGSWGFDAHRPGWGTPIHSLLVMNGVSAVFHGHDHVFVKQELDEIVYQECAQPSIARFDNTQLAEEYGYTHGTVVSSSGHLRVTITPEKATVEYVRAFRPQDETAGRKNGQVDCSYAIP
jgi:hypothetical protein